MLFIVFILHPVILLLHLQYSRMVSLQGQRGHSDSDVPLNVRFPIYIKTPRLTTFIARSGIPEVDIAHSQRPATKNLLDPSCNKCARSLSAPTHSHPSFQNYRLFFVTTGLQLKTADTNHSDPACMLLLFLPSGKWYQCLSSKTTWLKKK